jgi:hypothetical protein
MPDGKKPDWINRLATEEQAEADAAGDTRKIRLLNAKLISVKAPQFWEATLALIQQNADALRSTFPKDNSKHCSVIITGPVVKVQGAKLPWRILEFEAKFEAQCIEVFESEKQSRTDATEQKRTHIDITVGDDEALQFKFKFSHYKEPDALAQAIVEYVIRRSN